MIDPKCRSVSTMSRLVVTFQTTQFLGVFKVAVRSPFNAGANPFGRPRDQNSDHERIPLCSWVQGQSFRVRLGRQLWWLPKSWHWAFWKTKQPKDCWFICKSWFMMALLCQQCCMKVMKLIICFFCDLLGWWWWVSDLLVALEQLARQERLEDWEKYLTAVQDVVDVWLKAGLAWIILWFFMAQHNWFMPSFRCLTLDPKKEPRFHGRSCNQL